MDRKSLKRSWNSSYCVFEYFCYLFWIIIQLFRLYVAWEISRHGIIPWYHTIIPLLSYHNYHSVHDTMVLYSPVLYPMFRLTPSVSSLTRFLDQGVDLSGYHVPANVSSFDPRWWNVVIKQGNGKFFLCMFLLLRQNHFFPSCVYPTYFFQTVMQSIFS